MIVFRGQPQKSALDLWSALFPTATTLVCVENSSRAVDLANNVTSGTAVSRWSEWEGRLQSWWLDFVGGPMLELLKRNSSLETRYRLHDDYKSFKLQQPRQRFYKFYAVDNEDKVIFNHEIFRIDGVLDQYLIVPECVGCLSLREQKTSLIMPVLRVRV